MRTFDTLLETSVVLWILVLLVGAIDGVYYHLWKLRLFARRESRTEHLAHTVRAVLLAPLLFVGFVARDLSIGTRIGLLLVLMGSDLIAGLWDAVLERESRADLNGLPHSEYMVHVGVTGAHGAAEAFTIAAWVVAGPSDGERPLPAPVLATIALVLAAGAVLMAILHLALLHPRFSKSPPDPSTGQY